MILSPLEISIKRCYSLYSSGLSRSYLWYSISLCSKYSIRFRDAIACILFFDIKRISYLTKEMFWRVSVMFWFILCSQSTSDSKTKPKMLSLDNSLILSMLSNSWFSESLCKRKSMSASGEFDYSCSFSCFDMIFVRIDLQSLIYLRQSWYCFDLHKTKNEMKEVYAK